MSGNDHISLPILQLQHSPRPIAQDAAALPMTPSRLKFPASHNPGHYWMGRLDLREDNYSRKGIALHIHSFSDSNGTPSLQRQVHNLPATRYLVSGLSRPIYTANGGLSAVEIQIFQRGKDLGNRIASIMTLTVGLHILGCKCGRGSCDH